MPEETRRRWPIAVSIALGGAALLIVVGIVKSPGEAFRASLSGLNIWWQQVFPGLVPPLILAELLAASGLLHGLATLAEPLTRGWFRLPGGAAWAAVFGWTAGVPAGAKETARLRESGLIRDEDTDTLLLLSHVPNPFLVVVVAGGGFLHSPALGWAVAAGVWLSALAAGILWSRVTQTRTSNMPVLPIHPSGTLLRRAALAAAEARRADGRPLGKQLADAVTQTTGTLMVVGGLMMMASVVLRLAQLALPGSDAWLAVPGLYEMHLGAYESGRSPLFESAPAQAAALLAAALAWTGWSGLLQARAAFGNAGPFPWAKVIAGKLLHATLALLFTYPLAKTFVQVTPAFSRAWAAFLPNRWRTPEAMAMAAPPWMTWRQWPDMWLAGLCSLAIFLLLAALAAMIRPKPHSRDDGPPPSAGSGK